MDVLQRHWNNQYMKYGYYITIPKFMSAIFNRWMLCVQLLLLHWELLDEMCSSIVAPHETWTQYCVQLLIHHVILICDSPWYGIENQFSPELWPFVVFSCMYCKGNPCVQLLIHSNSILIWHGDLPWYFNISMVLSLTLYNAAAIGTCKLIKQN